MQIRYVDQMKVDDIPQYAEWADRSCAIACMMMLLRSWTSYAGNMMQLVSEMLEVDGYQVGVGWKHAQVCQILQNNGLDAQVERGLTPVRLEELSGQGRVVMLSVRSRVTPEGGHMILVVPVQAGIRTYDPYNEDGLGGVRDISLAELFSMSREKGISVNNHSLLES